MVYASFLTLTLVICLLGGNLFLCAGCGLGEAHVAPVYAKHSLAPLFVLKHNGFDTFYVKNLSGAFGASGWLLGVSWVLPGCFWVPPG